jgi:hypothetical protein
MVFEALYCKQLPCDRQLVLLLKVHCVSRCVCIACDLRHTTHVSTKAMSPTPTGMQHG